MKTTIPVFLLLLLPLTGCNEATQSSQSKPGTETAVEHAIKHLDPKYVCPMHPQIVRGMPGSCPICGMDLVAKAAKPEQGEKKILYWVAPMDPNYRRDGPGKSPMGMDLVPVYDEGGDDAAVSISPAVVNQLGVRTAAVEQGRLWRMIDTVGYIDVDESRISHVHLRTEGWIQKLYVSAEGERVKQGQALFDLYSPALINAQEEYIEALQSGNKRLVRASRDRLRSLDVSDPQIEALRQSRNASDTVTFYARQDGIVTSLKTPEGMYVKPADRVLSLVDLSSVWVQVEVFERQADWVKNGQPAEMTLSFLPGRRWEGKVDYVYPELDKKTRTLRVRLHFDNPHEDLKPNMYANVRLYAGPKDDIVYIPRQALIDSGREQRVILDQGKGRFVARTVVAGMESGDSVEILEGLQAGERVVVSGQFLIDSEASLKASLMRMQDGE
jgi:Cu(I)/Ag(I) efflux system membrane fusion protein